MKRWMISTVALLVLAAGLVGSFGCARGPAGVGEEAAVSSAEAHEGWLTSLDDGLAEAKKSGKMVLVDFAADW